MSLIFLMSFNMADKGLAVFVAISLELLLPFMSLNTSSLLGAPENMNRPREMSSCSSI